jgi:exodeoxyribonuclease VII large subunit
VLFDEITTTAPIAVSELVFCLQELIEDNFVQVLVQGELSNVSRPASGHLYFTLKDRKAQLRCAMFRSHARMLKFTAEEGMAVICRGRVSVYPQRGDLQLVVEGIEPEGIGSLQLAFEQIRAKLEAEGLFAEQRKKPLPAFPATIGLVTSATGAAIQDILQILRRRAVGVRVLLRSVRVQGEGAAAEIAEGIADLNRDGQVDVIIAGRGGGSKEDLWAFNEEVVARAIAASKCPVISAVGHETDITIADLVADLRAPTPSAAAELVVKNRLDLEQHLDHLMLRLGHQMQWHVNLMSARVVGLEKRLKAPLQLFQSQQLAAQQLQQRLSTAMRHFCENRHHRLNQLAGRLNALSPLAILERGYAIVQKEGQLVTASHQVACGDELDVRLADGRLKVATTKVMSSSAGKSA